MERPLWGQYGAVVAEKGSPVIIDCHTHWGMNWQAKCGLDPADWLKVPTRYGIDMAFVYPHAGLYRSECCGSDNESVAAICTRAPHRLIPVCTTWPQAGDEGVQEISRCLETLHMRGIKFHPWVQGFSTADVYLYQICEIAAHFHVPIFFHDGTPCYSLSSQIGGLARQFTKTQFVLGHSGLLWDWRSALEASRLPNVWSCLCGPHRRAIELFCDLSDTERLLWGSDYGVAALSDIVDYRLGLLLRARIVDSLKEKILGVNPLRLLRSSEH